MNTRSESSDEWLASVSDRVRRIPGFNPDSFIFLPLVALAAWAVVNWFLTLRSVVRDYNPLPVWDYWQVAEHLERYKALDLSVFWIQHNEHRIVFPEGVFAADMLWFHGHQIFSLAVSFCCYFAVWLILGWAFQTDKALSLPVRRAGFVLAGIIIGWQGSSVVLGNTFLLQWTLLELMVALGLALLAAARTGGAILAAVVATFSSANGMLLWPLLLIAGLLLRISKRRLIAIAVCGAAAIAVYFIGYHSTNHLELLNLIKHPVYFAGFVASYLSMPLGALGQPGAALAFGAFNLVSSLALLGFAARKGWLASTPGIVLFGFFVFTLATAALTAAGRMNASDPKFLNALAARFVTLPLVNWAVLFLVLLWIAARSRWDLLSPLRVLLLATVGLIALTSALRPWITGNGSFIAGQQIASLSVENGLLDPSFEKRLYPDPGSVSRLLPVLRNNHEAIYSGYPELSWLGKPAASLLGSCDSPQHGNISRVIPVQGGFELAGNASAVKKIIFVDERGRIIGFGEEPGAGVPSISEPVAKGEKYWVGFINSGFGSKSFAAFAMHGHGLCLIAPAKAL